MGLMGYLWSSASFSVLIVLREVHENACSLSTSWLLKIHVVLRIFFQYEGIHFEMLTQPVRGWAIYAA